MIDVTISNEPDQVERLKVLLEHAESEQGKRFALIDIGCDRLIVTSSLTGDDPAPFELRLLAAFAKPWADARAAYNVGFVDAIRAMYPDEAERPAHVRKAFHDAIVSTTVATQLATRLTQVAMSAFGLIARSGDDGEILWGAEGEGPA